MHEAVAFLVKAVAACLTGVENALQGQELINLVSKEAAGANKDEKKRVTVILLFKHWGSSLI